MSPAWRVHTVHRRAWPQRQQPRRPQPGATASALARAALRWPGVVAVAGTVLVSPAIFAAAVALQPPLSEPIGAPARAPAQSVPAVATPDKLVPPLKPASAGGVPGQSTIEVASVEQPRAYGYTIGDLLRQRVALGTAARPFLPGELPQVGRVGTSLWRRRSEVQTDADGRHWLLQEYQLINTPQALSVWYLPPLRLKPADRSTVLTVPRAPFTIMPFTPPQPFDESALPVLQPDRGPALVALAPIDRRVRAAAAALTGVLLLWAGASAWRHLRRGRHLPFARAWRDLHALPSSDQLAARRRLHRALNESAGEVVRPGSLGRLLARRPYLAAERDALERFLRDSQALFFAGGTAGDSRPVDRLAHSLRKLERRHAQ